MEMISTFFTALLELSNAMAPYILFGLFFAGILHEVVPDSLVTKHLGNDNIASVIKSTLFGIPLPVCSCGVIPLATSIKKSGASNGATLSFLISTPITGIDSILATFGMFGWLFTLYRVFTSMLIAIAAGIFTNFYAKTEPTPSPEAPVFSANPSGFTPAGVTTFATLKAEPETSCCAESCGCKNEENETQKRFSLRSAFRYAFVTLLGDIAKPLLWGLLLGALITVMIPQNLSEILQAHPALSYLIVIIIAVPMYVCATASLPIAAGLILSGVSAGAAFVFLSAGPATNTVTIGVVKKMLGKRALMIYLGTIVAGSVLFGIGLDTLFASRDIDVKSIVHIKKHAGFFTLLSSVLLWGAVLYLLVKSYFGKKASQSCCR